MMKTLLLITSTILSLYADDASLQQFLHAVESTSAARSAASASAVRYDRDRLDIEPDGFSVEGILANADAKHDDRTQTEYHLSLEKEFTLASKHTDAYLGASKIESSAERGLRLIDLKSSVYRHYVSVCMDEQRIRLLDEALRQSKALDALIKEGVESGEFDRSKSLLSELETDEIILQSRLIKASFENSRTTLWSYTNMEGVQPRCNDLVLLRIDEKQWAEASLLRQKKEAQISKNSHLYEFADSWAPRLTAGIGYDDEMDVSRTLAFVRIPLPYGGKNEAKRSAALHQKSFREEETRTLDIQASSKIRTFNAQQKSRMTVLTSLMQTMIPKAQEASTLLKERFLGAEGTFMEYAQSRKKLFELQNQAIDIRQSALLSQAEVYKTLGIDPTEESQ